MYVYVCYSMICYTSTSSVGQAARNCLVGERNVVKVANFGQARFIVDEYTPSRYEKTELGNTCRWAPPEVIAHAVFTHKSDVWSYGELYVP